ncbi:NAD(P)H-hydrate epimerase [Pseudomonas duriflava]|uniref:Bifunctional NAD(P)H-hydrate repair enzyme n=1 Tax=Pseudomonas duriflava TaxID=459528 RepID=A0A562Q6P0_9PSED|nr:NAD(P)H-hydrate dehydratase [Pseudomonas duriflava]TWI52393.1 NAD(P)H-hydrate epimerase [Pseudomonas duriflava]
MHDDLPLSLYSAAQVRALDARLIASGTPGFELMHRAARAAWRALRQRWPDAGAITVFAGGGNNGGDGYLIAALAQRAGWPVRVYHLNDPATLKGDAAHAYAEATGCGARSEAWKSGAELSGVIVDALLGTGFSGSVRDAYAEAIKQINASPLPVLAVDVPSGLNADTGAVTSIAVQANLTVTFIGVKLGLLTGEGPDHCGELEFAALVEEPQNPADALAQRLSPRNLPRLPPRKRSAHKGNFGHVLVMGGNEGTGGAAMMTSEAALRCGAGMVSLATRPSNVAAALARRPEIMVAGVESSSRVISLVEKADVLAVGPGLGQGAWSRSLLSVAASRDIPQVWDADALNLLAGQAVSTPKGPWIMTPHPGEAARLLRSDTATVQNLRPTAARKLAERYGAVVLLKGLGTLIAAPDGRMALCGRGHPAMATGGAGDVLTGIIAALLAQHLPAFEAACLGAWLHGRAGELLGQHGRGLAASDFPDTVRQLLESYNPCLK